MTQYEPALLVNRLVAKISGKTAYDENFHLGLNVFSGCNGGGKTSVIQLLVHGLGYEVKRWKDEAKLCDTVYVDISINGNPLTLKRKNGDRDKQPVDICFKSFDEAIKSGPEEWKNYPYSINTARESYSQKIFSLLNIPEVKIDSSNNITFHQILRLIYSDQSNVSGSFFNVEPFDSALKREAIGHYLLGLYDNDLYKARMDEIEADKSLDKVIAKLNAIYSVLGKTSYANDLLSVEEVKKSCLDEIDGINSSILKKKSSVVIAYKNEKDTTENYASNNIKIKTKLLGCEENIQALAYEIEDSDSFISELQDKSSAINDSIKLGNVLPDIQFKICPSCFVEVKTSTNEGCYLCGSSEGGGRKEFNLLRMKNEIDIQVRESFKLLEKKKHKFQEYVDKRKLIRSELRKNISEVSATISSVNTSFEKEMFDCYRRIGEIEERIENLEKIKELHESIKILSEEREYFQSEVNRNRDIIELKSIQKIKRTPEVLTSISEHLVDILKSDVGAEKEFENANEVEFDFAANRISVNGKTAFSESGTVYLNNAFHFSLFLVSIDKKYVRLPRFMILDGIENGGMEEVRSRNFQKVISDKLKNIDSPHQIILATKSIHKDLDNTSYVVGDTFTKTEQSLKV